MLEDLIKRLRDNDDWHDAGDLDAMRNAADLIEQQAARLTALESERDALLAAAGKEAVAVDAQRMTEIARKWIKEGSEASPEFYWGDFYDCVREIIAAGDGRDALESALRQIADQEHIELMLDPTWAQRIAIAALSQKAGEQQ